MQVLLSTTYIEHLKDIFKIHHTDGFIIDDSHQY